MIVTHTLEVQLGTVGHYYGLSPVTAVALPPSDLDPAAGKMRRYVDGVLTILDYDETMEQP